MKLLAIDNPVQCTILSRVNRFVVEVEVNGKSNHASINNTGRLLEFIAKGTQGFCVPHPRIFKTDYRLFAIRHANAGALIDTQLQMTAFERALEMGLIPWLEK